MVRRVACLLLATGCGGAELEASNPGPLVGTVGVFLFREAGDTTRPFETVLTASFDTGSSRESCTEVQFGACTRKDCTWDSADLQAAASPHAGRITASSDGRTMVVQPQAEGPYRSRFEPIALWEPGRSVLVEAEGDQIPGFSVEMVGPSETLIVAPPPPTATSSLIADRGEGLLITWQETSAGEMHAFLSVQNGHSSGLISCRYPGESGGDLIPGELLSDFNPQGSTMRLTLGIGRSTFINSGGSSIEVVLYTNAMSEIAGNASYPVRFR
jgi:hypothetical protein